MSGESFLKMLLRIVPWGFFALAIVFGAGSAGFGLHEQSFLRSAATEEGIVVALHERTDSENSTVYAPEFSFKTPDGLTHTVLSSTGTNPAGYEVGQRVPVIYDPAKPNGAEINSFWQQWLITVVFGVISGAFLFAAICFWILGWFLGRRRPASVAYAPPPAPPL